MRSTVLHVYMLAFRVMALVFWTFAWSNSTFTWLLEYSIPCCSCATMFSPFRSTITETNCNSEDSSFIAVAENVTFSHWLSASFYLKLHCVWGLRSGILTLGARTGREESALVLAEDREERKGGRRRPWFVGLFNLHRTVRWLWQSAGTN